MKGELLIFMPGQIIFKEGDASTGLYFVKEGKIEIYRTRDNTDINLAYLNPGDVLGTLTVFNKEPRTACARATLRCTIVHVTGESLESALKNIPLWAVAILKDTIIRLKGIDEKLCDAKLLEKKLMHKVGTQYHHASQLAAFLGAMTRAATINEDGVILFPLKGFVENAENILLQRAEYLSKIVDYFVTGGLIKKIEDKKYGTSISNPKPDIYEDFSNFCKVVIKDGNKSFTPSKQVSYMSGLLRIHKKIKTEWISRKDLNGLLSLDLGRTTCDAVLLELLNQNVIRSKPGTEDTEVQYSPILIHKKIIFEGTCRLLEDLSQNGEN